MQLKIHDSYRKILALCDTELVGQIFTEGIKQIKITENFFKGDEKTKQQALEILQDMNKEDATFYIVGQESIQTALEAKIISKEGIIKIEDVPVALGLM